MKEQSIDKVEEKAVFNKIKQVIDKNKASDLFHKAFLRPQEIALKTWRTEKDLTKAHDSLPYGLKQAIKKDISLNQYVLKDFQSFDALDDKLKGEIRYISENNYDNLISLIKPKGQQQQIQLCICICMYSQDKSMLRKTLAGVSNNIATFAKNGISADDIVVAVMIDGIQKVDTSVVDFFGELEKESCIYLDDDVEPLQAKEIVSDNLSEVDEEQVININNFIFDEIQLEDRKKRRFSKRKSEYQQVRKMGKNIQKLQSNKKIIFEDLDDFLKPFFFQKARQDRKKNFSDPSGGMEKVTDEQLLKEYGDNLTKCRPIISQALNDAKFYCQKYIQTRDPLALMNSYRVQVTFGSFQNKYKKISNQQEATKFQNLNQQYIQDQPVKMNLLFITKYKNSGKLSSHNWFFNGLCRQIKCQFSVLLDVGLCPEKTSIYKMYRYMKSDERCGGVCGYMNLRIERLQDEDQKYYTSIDWVSKLFLHVVDIQRAQQVQYHFSHLMDKPFQALFKFIHVLPGAFSAYRSSALKLAGQQDSKLMREYFKSLDESISMQLITTKYSTSKAILKVVLPDLLFYFFYPQTQQKSDEQFLYDSNVYLAQDRTLCMGIHQNGFNLEYLPDAHAWVDPIKNLHGLMGQRKRWINGSFFAFEAVKRGLREYGDGDCCLKVQIAYLTLMNMMAFVAPAIFMFTIHIAMSAFRDWFFGNVLAGLSQPGSSGFQTTEFYNAFVYVMDFIYIMIMLSFIFQSMHFTHRTQRFIQFSYAASTIMGIFAIIVIVVLLVDMVQGIVDTIRCGGRAECSITFLTQNPKLRDNFFNVLPGHATTFLVYKWLVVGVVALYAIPIMIYATFFCKWQFLGDVIFGAFSFAFYTPTYLNILNTFALCRIDDISWGTKGLDAEVGKGNNLKDAWKSIKIMHVAKYIFWNIVIGTAMLIISSPLDASGVLDQERYNNLIVASYVRKFFMTFALMIIIGFSLFLKILIGAMYNISYRCTRRIDDKQIMNNEKVVKMQSKVQKYFQIVKPSMDQQLEEYIGSMVGDLKKTKKPIKIKNINEIPAVSKKLADGKKRAQDKWKKNVQSKSKLEKHGHLQKKKKPSTDRHSPKRNKQNSHEKDKRSPGKNQQNNHDNHDADHKKRRHQSKSRDKNKKKVQIQENNPNAVSKIIPNSKVKNGKKQSNHSNDQSHDKLNQAKAPPGPHSNARNPSPQAPKKISQQNTKPNQLVDKQKSSQTIQMVDQMSSEAFLKSEV